MSEHDTCRVSIPPAGAPGAASLEICGTILIYRRRSWVAAFSAYLPVEWIVREDARRLDWQRLWQGVIALLIAVLFVLPLGLCAMFRTLLTPGDALWLLPMGLCCAVACGCGCVLLAKFAAPRPCTTLRIPGAGGRALTIRFWRDAPGEAAGQRIDAMLAALEEQHAAMERGAAPTLHINHGWYQPDPYRMAFFKGLVISFFLYLALLAWAVATFLAGLAPAPWWCFAFLAAPPCFHLLLAALRDLDALRAPDGFRRARRHYRRGELEAARTHLGATLEAAPEALPARTLMVRVCAELGALEDALWHCGRLAKARPREAAVLEENLWAMRRLRSRMEHSPAAAE